MLAKALMMKTLTRAARAAGAASAVGLARID